MQTPIPGLEALIPPSVSFDLEVAEFQEEDEDDPIVPAWDSDPETLLDYLNLGEDARMQMSNNWRNPESGVWVSLTLDVTDDRNSCQLNINPTLLSSALNNPPELSDLVFDPSLGNNGFVGAYGHVQLKDLALVEGDKRTVLSKPSQALDFDHETFAPGTYLEFSGRCDKRMLRVILTVPLEEGKPRAIVHFEDLPALRETIIEYTRARVALYVDVCQKKLADTQDSLEKNLALQEAFNAQFPLAS